MEGITKKQSYQSLKRRIAQIVEADDEAGPAQLSLLFPLLKPELRAAVACGISTNQITRFLKGVGLRTSKRSVERHLPQIVRRRLPRSDKPLSADSHKRTATQIEPFADPFAKSNQREMIITSNRKQPLLSYEEIEKRARLDVFPGTKKVSKHSVTHPD